MYVKSTCAHIFSLSIGFFIIIGITLLAKSLRVSTHEPHVINCFNCNYNAHFPISCINKESFNETTCHGVCVMAILEGNRSKMFSQSCYNQSEFIVSTPDCPVDFRQNATDHGFNATVCSTCSTDFCNEFLADAEH